MSHGFVWYFLYSSSLFIILLFADTLAINTIEGRIVFPPDVDGLQHTRILVNEGEFVGIPRVDGSFVIASVPHGSYTVSISSSTYIFHPVRVDITKNGKIRARKLNLIDPRETILVKYPLHFETDTKANYFQKREIFQITDFIFHPTFISIIGPIIMLIFLPKLLPDIQDMPDVQQQMNNLVRPQLALPDLTDIVMRFFNVGIRRRR